MINPITFRPMKFWEVVSAFRDAPETLETVFNSDKWRTEYLELYLKHDEIVDRQDRGILETLIPTELSREIAVQYKVTYDLYPGFKHPLIHGSVNLLRQHAPEGKVDGRPVQLTALEVHDRFGGYAIEEVAEFGSCYVTETLLESPAKNGSSA